MTDTDTDTLLGAFQNDVLGRAQRLEPGLLSCRWGVPEGSEAATPAGVVVTFPHAPSAETLTAIGTSYEGQIVHIEIP